MSKKILVTGSLAYDVLLTSDGSFLDSIKDATDELSVSFLASRVAQHHGGTGVNITWNLNLLGAHPLLIATVGSDGGKYIALLEECGISTEYIDRHEDVLTATAIVATDSDENQITFFHPGADAKGEWPDLTDIREDIGYAIVSPRDERVMVHAMQWCQKNKVPVLFDPGQRLTSISADDLSRLVRLSSGVVVNEYEWELMSKALHCTEENFAELSPLLIITRGENGVTFFNEEGAQTVGACKPDQVVNPTGAGDAFRAGLLLGLNNEWSLVDSCRLGVSMGSFSVENEGTLINSLDREAVWNRAEQTFEEKLPSLL